jgi:hypothetical protein
MKQGHRQLAGKNFGFPKASEIPKVGMTDAGQSGFNDDESFRDGPIHRHFFDMVGVGEPERPGVHRLRNRTQIREHLHVTLFGFFNTGFPYHLIGPDVIVSSPERSCVPSDG